MRIAVMILIFISLLSIESQGVTTHSALSIREDSHSRAPSENPSLSITPSEHSSPSIVLSEKNALTITQSEHSSSSIVLSEKNALTITQSEHSSSSIVLSENPVLSIAHSESLSLIDAQSNNSKVFHSQADLDETPRSSNQCSTIDFRSHFPLKMRNQKNVSWCFAHSSADFLQNIYRLETQISAADIAIRYSASKASRIITGFKKIFNRGSGLIPAQTGFIKIATDLILKEGYCPESALPSETWKKTYRDGTVESIEISKAILDTLKLQEDFKKGLYPDPDSLPWFFSFKHIDRERFFDLLEISDQKNIFLKLRDFACSTERKQFPFEIKTAFRIKSNQFLDQIDSSFEQGKPVTLDFFSDVLRNPDSPKRSIDELHTVLLYGRKFDHQKNECLYLIKDSYGEQCRKYAPSLECESGYVWMPAKKLHRAATSTLIHSQSFDSHMTLD